MITVGVILLWYVVMYGMVRYMCAYLIGDHDTGRIFCLWFLSPITFPAIVLGFICAIFCHAGLDDISLPDLLFPNRRSR